MTPDHYFLKAPYFSEINTEILIIEIIYLVSLQNNPRA
jgi:hypothetical protein